MHFTSTLAPSSTPQIFPRSLTGPGYFWDTFSKPTLLLVGAVLQAALCAVAPLRVALLPAALLLARSVVTTLLQAQLILPNEYMAGVVPGKATAQLPAGDGTGARTALGDQPVVVFLLGMQVNHPLGAFAPGVREIGKHFDAMEKDLKEHSEAYGLLGASGWRGDQHRRSSNQILYIMYFRTVEGLNRFAHGPAHRAGWDHYNKMGYRHIGFMHEAFSVPRRAYESVYLNCSPHLLGGTSTKRVQDDEGNGLEKEEWMNPLVSAEKGVLRSSLGRLSMSQGKEQEQYGEIPHWHKVDGM